MKIGLAVLLALAGCGKRSNDKDEPAPAAPPPPDAAVDGRPERIVLTEVSVGIIEEEGRAPRIIKSAAAPLMASLAMTGWFAADADSVPRSHRPRLARLDVAIATSVLENRATGSFHLIAGAEGTVRWQDRGEDPEPNERVVFERDLGKARPTPEQLEELAATAAGMVTKGLAADEAIRSGPPEHMKNALASVNPNEQLWALMLVRERKLRDMLDPAAALLASPDADVRERALGALLAIGDPRAAGAIADHARTDDLPFLRNAIDAVAVLGGPDAIEWLEFLGGHGDPEIRAQATRALEKVRARATPPN
jgi:hypothetical protein